jgi:acetolactate synthase-1/2/3 large subunit
VLLLGGAATREPGLRAAARVAAATGARLLCETFPARLERGAGLPAVDRLSRAPGAAARQLAGARHLVLVDAAAPVEFFAYPDQSGDLVPGGCQVHLLATARADVVGALAALADALGASSPGAGAGSPRAGSDRASGPADLPTGPLTPAAVAGTLAALLPEGAVVADESVTAGRGFPAATAGAPRHDWLTLTGGSIGMGLPLAAGAAVACPDRPVVCLQADGSALYTLSALWTHAREGLDITTVLLNNRSYAILEMELARVGAAAAGPVARSLLDLSRPDLDFVALARGMGVPAQRATTAEEFNAAFAGALREPGPHLVEVLLPRR